MKQPKIAFLDIETSPNIVTTFDIKGERPIHHQNIQQERYVICASYKWAGAKKLYSYAVNTRNPTDDWSVLKAMQDMFSQANAVVAHFGDGFDVPFINTRLAFHEMEPLAPVVQIDTYKMARRKFLFNSNKLDYLGKYLGLGSKEHINHSAWIGCLKGNPLDLQRMVKYNKQDVVLLEAVYERLKAHCEPKFKEYDSQGVCNRCGSKNVTKKGIKLTKTGKRQQFQCQLCGGWQTEKFV